MFGKMAVACIAFSMLVASCAPFSWDIMRRADEGITVEDVQRSPDRYMDRLVLWGGVITETTSEKNESLIKVLRTDLGTDKEPKNLRAAEGRFIVKVRGFLDPVVYRAGRLITVAGEITGIQDLPLSNTQYAYPVVRSKEIHLWENGEYYGTRPPSFWYDPNWWQRYPFWYTYPASIYYLPL
jgi:outer membrane lipoprotein